MGEKVLPESLPPGTLSTKLTALTTNDVKIGVSVVAVDKILKLGPAAGPAAVPGSLGIQSSAVAQRLLERIAEVCPAGRSKIFASPPVEDQLLLEVLALLREVIEDATDNFDLTTKGKVW